MSVLRRAYATLAAVLRSKATGALELELHELEATLALLVVGSLVGLPAVPPAISLKLLPHLSRELEALFARAALQDDVLALLAGHLDVG